MLSSEQTVPSDPATNSLHGKETTLPWSSNLARPCVYSKRAGSKDFENRNSHRSTKIHLHSVESDLLGSSDLWLPLDTQPSITPLLAFPALANFLSKGRSPSGEKVGKRTLLGRPLRNFHIFNDQGFDLFWTRIRIGHGNSPTKRVSYQDRFRCALVFVFHSLQSTMNIFHQCFLKNRQAIPSRFDRLLANRVPRHPSLARPSDSTFARRNPSQVSTLWSAR